MATVRFERIVSSVDKTDRLTDLRTVLVMLEQFTRRLSMRLCTP
jgi:hypothetical protein